MYIIIRNNGTMSAKIVGASVVSHYFDSLKPIMRKCEKGSDNECLAVYRITKDSVIPINTGVLGNEIKVYLWEKDTTIVLYD